MQRTQPSKHLCSSRTRPIPTKMPPLLMLHTKPICIPSRRLQATPRLLTLRFHRISPRVPHTPPLHMTRRLAIHPPPTPTQHQMIRTQKRPPHARRRHLRTSKPLSRIKVRTRHRPQSLRSLPLPLIQIRIQPPRMHQTPIIFRLQPRAGTPRMPTLILPPVLRTPPLTHRTQRALIHLAINIPPMPRTPSIKPRPPITPVHQAHLRPTMHTALPLQPTKTRTPRHNTSNPPPMPPTSPRRPPALLRATLHPTIRSCHPSSPRRRSRTLALLVIASSPSSSTTTNTTTPTTPTAATTTSSS